MVDILVVFIPGLIIGIIFGIILQRGRFCMNSAFRDIILLKEYNLLKAVVLAISVSMLGFAIMFFSSIITLNPKPLAPIANIIGGFLFGIGMVLAAGCASGTTYRVGEGMMGSLVALLGFAIGAIMVKFGPLNIIATSLQSVQIKEAGGANPTVFGAALTPYFMLIIGIVGILLILIYWIRPEHKNKEKKGEHISIGEKIFKKGWPWTVTGVAIGILACFAYVSSAAAGRNYPLGITGGWVGWLKFLVTGDETALNWEVFEVLGIVIGGFIAAVIAREFKLRTPKDGKRILIQYIGGFTMGVGAIIALGCNIGNILSGFPLLSLGSLLAGAFIILGCWFMAYLMFMRGD